MELISLSKSHHLLTKYIPKKKLRTSSSHSLQVAACACALALFETCWSGIRQTSWRDSADLTSGHVTRSVDLNTWDWMHLQTSQPFPDKDVITLQKKWKLIKIKFLQHQLSWRDHSMWRSLQRWRYALESRGMAEYVCAREGGRWKCECERMVVNHPQRGEEERAGRVEWVCSETCCYGLEAAHLLLQIEIKN